MRTPSLLSVFHLKKYFPVGGSLFKARRYLRANDDISFDIHEGETFGLVGESGSGKSTLGRTILRLYEPTSGKILYRGDNGKEIDLTTLKGEEMRKLRSDLQMIFQDPYSSLNPRMTVGQIIEEGVATHKYYKRGTPQMREYVLKIMADCGLQAEALHRYPHQFSGGQRQRVSIARALAVKPKFIVCDECVSALDASIQSQILNLLAELKEREKLTYLFISHDLSVVRHISDRIAVMYLGNIVEMGTAKQVFENPRHPYTIALMSAVPSMKSGGEKKIVLGGNMPSPVSPPEGCKFHTRCFMACEKCKREIPPFATVEEGHFASCHFADKRTEEKRRIAESNERQTKKFL